MAGQPGGITYRDITEPTRWERVRYYAGGLLPVKYRNWVELDIASPSWPLRNILARVGAVMAAFAIVILVTGGRWYPMFGALLGAVLVAPIAYLMRERNRRRALERQRRYWRGA